MAKNQNQETVVVPQAPEGFRRLGSADSRGWFNQSKVGNAFYGTLTGMFERKDELRPEGVSKFFQVLLSQDCEVREGSGEDATMVMAKAGETINVNYGPRTKMLETLIKEIHAGAVYEVYGVIASAKRKLKGGKTMHNLDVLVKMTKAPDATVEESEPDFDGAADDLA
jgi:hypothetical protein